MNLCRGRCLLPLPENRAGRHRGRRRTALVAALAALLLAGPLVSPPVAQPFSIPDLSSLAAEPPGALSPLSAETGVINEPLASKAKLAPSLQQRIAAKTAGQTGAARLPQAAAPARIKVILQLAAGTILAPDRISSRDGRILQQRPNLVAADLPVDRIEALVDEEPGIAFARLPQRFRPFEVTSEGVSLTGAAIFHSFGYRGAGIKVAVIDVGFKGLTQAKANGDLPSDVITHDFSGRGLETQYKHGTACAEIIHDMAPEAELHLLKVGDEEDFYAAYDYCLQQGIRIISLSIGTVGSGPGDGTGPLQELCNEARAKGILVVAAAGNGGNFSSSDGYPLGSHWKGLFTDANQDSIHEFAAGVQSNILLGMPDHDDDGNPEDNEVTVVMRWNDWPLATSDYDMYLYAYNYYPSYTRGALVAYSNGLQNGSQPPVEAIVVDLPDTPAGQFYELVVTRKAGSPAGKELEIFTAGNSFFLGATARAAPLATSAGSIWEPADAASVFTVGAVNGSSPYSSLPEDYSSRGPTNAWAGSAGRIKPDICGPDGVKTYTYGESGPGFSGTSAAAPHVAGAAALLWSLHPNLPPAEVQSTLESWAWDMGESGKDNLSGWGRLRLLTYTLYIHKFGSGRVSSAPAGIDCGSTCSAPHLPGASVTLTASPEEGFTFLDWGGTCSGTGPCSVTMDGNKDVYAAFDRIIYPIAVAIADNGPGLVITPNNVCTTSCSASGYWGTTASLTAHPYEGSTFAGWSGDCSGTGDCTLTMDGPKNVTATFVRNVYDVTPSPAVNGSLSCDVLSVSHGSPLTCTVVPQPGYHLASLTDNGVDMTPATLGNTYRIPYVTSSHTLTAVFAPDPYILEIAKAGTGSGLVAGTPGGLSCGTTCLASYPAATSVALTATPGDGSTFAGWSGRGCTGTEQSCTLTVNDRILVTALFSCPWGDLNRDNRIDLADAVLSLQILTRSDGAAIDVTLEADVNGDRKLGLAETVYILQKAAGLR